MVEYMEQEEKTSVAPFNTKKDVTSNVERMMIDAIVDSQISIKISLNLYLSSFAFPSHFPFPFPYSS